MVQKLVAPIMIRLMPDWSENEARRFVNLAAFQIAILALYLLTRQLVAYPAALGITLLFSLQPLYVGHAFINGKDTPFMAMFLLSVALGYSALRSFPSSQAGVTADKGSTSPGFRVRLRQDWCTAHPAWKAALVAASVVPLAVAADLLIFDAVVRPQLLRMVSLAYEQKAPAAFNYLFDQLAEERHTVPEAAYLNRASQALDKTRLPMIGLSGLPLALVAGLAFPRVRRGLWRGAQHNWRSLTHDPLGGWTSRRHLALLASAGLAAGIATSIRVVAPLAMLLVGILYISRHGTRALPPLLFYGLTAVLACILLWPYLWTNPVGHLLESYRFFMGNPNKDYVLFMGEVTKGRLLPWFFLPWLMLLQFTEPLWILLAAAVVLLILHRLNPSPTPLFLAILGIWLLAPTVPLVLQHAWFYDNFRQFLFVTPVFFLVAAFALDFLFASARFPLLRLGLGVLILLPGAIQIVRLHPYQYVYYNSLVGGSSGAVRQYELDYWATSYGEATRYLNSVLPYGAIVAYLGPTASAEPHARSDLTIRSFETEEDLLNMSADAVVMMTRANGDLGILPSVPALAEVSIDNALLAVIKLVPDASGQLGN
jgi:hypothetical protein